MLSVANKPIKQSVFIQSGVMMSVVVPNVEAPNVILEA
jgi:hypothetical protein